MNLYKISQEVNNNYDTYDSAVVCADSESAARIICPGGYHVFHDNDWYFQYHDGTERVETNNFGFSWAHPDKVKVELIGTAAEGLQPGVIVASFNAG